MIRLCVGLLGILFCVVFAALGSAQVITPTAQEVYGGRINWIESVAVGSIEKANAAYTSYTFVSTESANSLFFSSLDFNAETHAPAVFQSVPDLDSEGGFGSITRFVVDPASLTVFFAHQSGLWSAGLTENSLAQITAEFVSQSLLAKDGRLFYVLDSKLVFGDIAPDTGVFTEDAASPATLPQPGAATVACSPVDGHLYVYQRDSQILRSSVPADAITDSTTFTVIGLPITKQAGDWASFTLGPDGRLFLGAALSKTVAYTDNDDDTGWVVVDTGVAGIGGGNLETSGTTDAYDVFFGTAASNAKGAAGSWGSMPRGGTFETHPNDGAVRRDAQNPDMIYLTTDQGIGFSEDRGANIREINAGVEAVQVNDIDMALDKNVGWAASKSGVRRVTNYLSAPVWSGALFPQGDGSPYYAVAVDHFDGTQNTAYAGNVRVYKTTDGGAAWVRQLSAEEAPVNLPSATVGALATSTTRDGLVAAGFYDARDEAHGALYLSLDGGDTWAEIVLEAGGVDVYALLFIEEPAGETLYVGVGYSADNPSGAGVYRVRVDAEGGISAVQDLANSVTINDLAVESDGGIVAVGANDATMSPAVFHKELGGSWEVPTTDGLPMMEVSAVAVGVDPSNTSRQAPYVAVGERVYVLEDGAIAWRIYYSYPAGTQLNALYWDELIVGSGTGITALDVSAETAT
ncbi:MAG: hypothetical protein L3K26_18540, partial [Candidatus Hydrogenedentes bacterium]|nr:hypothetical protein [Candidatus Hydrogenedentota bacterium]